MDSVWTPGAAPPQATLPSHHVEESSLRTP